MARPKKLSDAKRETIVRDYVGLCDIVDLASERWQLLERPYQKDFIRELASYHKTTKRMVKRCLDEANLRLIYDDNRRYLRELADRNFLKNLNKICDNKK